MSLHFIYLKLYYNLQFILWPETSVKPYDVFGWYIYHQITPKREFEQVGITLKKLSAGIFHL